MSKVIVGDLPKKDWPAGGNGADPDIVKSFSKGSGLTAEEEQELCKHPLDMEKFSWSKELWPR